MRPTHKLLAFAGLLGALSAPHPPRALGQAAAQPDLAACRRPYPVDATRRTRTRVLSVGDEHWELFDAATGTEVARGALALGRTHAFSLDVASDWALLPGAPSADLGEALQLIRLATGEVVTTIPGDGPEYRAGLSRGGDYVWRATPTSLTLFDLAGGVINQVAGNYLKAETFAAAGELRMLVDEGSEDVHRVKLGVVRSETSAPVQWRLGPPMNGSAPDGVHAAWFLDGNHYFIGDLRFSSIFVTASNEPARILGAQDYTQISGGFGQHYWGFTRDTRIYSLAGAIDANGLPRPAYTSPRRRSHMFEASDGSVAQLDLSVPKLLVADLRGATPAVTEVVLPAPPRPHTFSADPAGGWAIVADNVVFASEAGTPASAHALGCRAP